MVCAQVYNSFGLAYRLTNQAEYADRVLTGADTLYGFRWQVRERVISSHDPTPQYPEKKALKC